jgi:catechol 2,3-dioxygenase-like lactoylglutathione lyase family enzyme
MSFRLRAGRIEHNQPKEEAPMPETASAVGIKQAVNIVCVPVVDADRAIAFYTEKLGFETRADVPFGNGERWVEVGPPGSTTTLALVPGRNETTPGTNSRVIMHVDDIEAVHAELKSRGVDVDPEITNYGGPVPPMFWFRDQDQNVHLIVRPSLAE